MLQRCNDMLIAQARKRRPYAVEGALPGWKKLVTVIISFLRACKQQIANTHRSHKLFLVAASDGDSASALTFPEDGVLRCPQSSLRSLRLLNAQTTIKPGIPFSNTISFDFDMQSPIDRGLRSPKALSLVLYESSPQQNILFETYCKNVTELSL